MAGTPFAIAVTSLKPHAGRTTTALALAWALGRSGRRVLLVDANPYPTLGPSSSRTGSPELWQNVIIGSSQPGEAKRVGADIVVVDAPPLTGKNSNRILAVMDAVLVAVFPIVQNKRFLAAAREELGKLEPGRVLGWFAAKIDGENQLHHDLIQEVRTELAEWSELRMIPSDPEVPMWEALGGADLPEGPLSAAYTELACSVLAHGHFAGEAPSSSGAQPAAPFDVDLRAAAAHAAGAGNSHPKTPIPAREAGASRAPAAAARGETDPATAAGDGKDPAAAARGGKAPDAVRGGTAPAAPAPRKPAPPEGLPDGRAPGVTEGHVPATPFLPARQLSLPTQGTWRLLGNPVSLGVRLVAHDTPFKLADGTRAYLDGLAEVHLRALLHHGVVATYTAGASGDGEVERLLPWSELELPAKPRKVADQDPLTEACRLLEAGDTRASVPHFEKLARADSRFLSGFLNLKNGDAEKGARQLAGALRQGLRLGVDLGQIGLDVLVDLVFVDGLACHFTTNVRGARLLQALAQRKAGQLDPSIEETARLAEDDPEDVLFTLLHAEGLLERGNEQDLKLLQRLLPAPSFGTLLHTTLALYRAEALHGLGLSAAALEGLDAVVREAPRPGALRRAALLQRARAAEHLGLAELARRDLELICAEDPDEDAADQSAVA